MAVIFIIESTYFMNCVLVFQGGNNKETKIRGRVGSGGKLKTKKFFLSKFSWIEDQNQGVSGPCSLCNLRGTISPSLLFPSSGEAISPWHSLACNCTISVSASVFTRCFPCKSLSSHDHLLLQGKRSTGPKWHQVGQVGKLRLNT